MTSALTKTDKRMHKEKVWAKRAKYRHKVKMRAKREQNADPWRRSRKKNKTARAREKCGNRIGKTHTHT